MAMNSTFHSLLITGLFSIEVLIQLGEVFVLFNVEIFIVKIFIRTKSIFNLLLNRHLPKWTLFLPNCI